MYTGVLTALVTPMNEDGAVDHRALAELVEWQIECGIEGLVPCGTTGEAATLTAEERAAVIRTTVGAARGRVPVVAGSGANATQATIELSKAALEAGADGLLLVCPYYNKPTQAGLEAHFRAVLDAVEAPVLLYNIPSRTGVDLSVETFVALAEHPQVVGIKEATGQVTRSAELVKGLDGRAAVLAGDDALYLPVLAIGGQGIVSASACVAPRQMVEVMRAYRAGRHDEARSIYLALLDVFDAMFLETNPGPAKVALHLMGKISPAVRLPLVWPGDETVDRIRATLHAGGLLGA